MIDPSHDFEADRAVEDKRHRAERFLVPADEGEQLVSVRLGRQPVGQLVAAHHRSMLGDPIGVDAPEMVGQFGGVHEADADRLAVAQVVPAGRLERVSERVAVVQQRPALGFALVVSDDRGLDLDAPRDALLDRERGKVLAGEEVTFAAGVADPARRLGPAELSRLLAGATDAR